MPAVEWPRRAQKYTEVKEMGTIEYIQTRAQGIAKYSDKLEDFEDLFEYTCSKCRTRFKKVVPESHTAEIFTYGDPTSKIGPCVPERGFYRSLI